MKNSLLKNTAVLSISLLLTVGSVPSVLAQQISVRAASNANVRVAPIALNLSNPVGRSLFSGGMKSSLTGGLSGIGSLSAPQVNKSGASIPLLPNAMVPSVPKMPAAAPASLPLTFGTLTPGGPKSVGTVSREITKAIEGAGPITKGSADSARGLGGSLIDILQNGLKGDRSGAPVVPAMDFSSPKKGSGGSGSRGSKRSQAATKVAMVQTLEFVASVFSAHYAPLDWKGEKFGIELKKELEKAKTDINDAPYITTKEFQNIVARFVSSLKDYHVGIQFHATEAAILPLNIAGAEGEYYLTNVDRQMLPKALFPFEAGDQVIEFDGRPVAEVVTELRRQKGPNSILTDTDLADLRLTRRLRAAGDLVPEGPVSMRIRTKDGELHTVKLEWLYVEEMVPQDVPIRDAGNLIGKPGVTGEDFDFGDTDAPPEASVFKRAKEAVLNLLPSALNPLAKLLSGTFPQEAENPFAIGARKSFVPDLGPKIWEAPEGSPFDAYIYKTEDGKRMGYIRIPSYLASDEAMGAEYFGHIISKFQAETDGLVLDQVNNPGGSVFFLYALLSRLIDKPIEIPKHKIIVGEADAAEAAQILQLDPMIQTDFDAMRVLGPTMGGLPVTLKIWKGFVSYAKTIMAELKAGNRLTAPTPMMGMQTIDPHPTQRFSKPIMVLTNPLDFSAADFLPAILQDNGRATTFGSRTAGAGGAVKATQFPNQFGIAMIAYTWTIALRLNGDPIENLGVKPDRSYRIKAVDLRDNFSGYKAALNKAVKSMIRRAPARPDEASSPDIKLVVNDASAPQPAKEDEEGGSGTLETSDPANEREDAPPGEGEVDPKKDDDPKKEVDPDGPDNPETDTPKPNEDKRDGESEPPPDGGEKS